MSGSGRRWAQHGAGPRVKSKIRSFGMAAMVDRRDGARSAVAKNHRAIVRVMQARQVMQVGRQGATGVGV
jgi:hypothetical protein